MQDMTRKRPPTNVTLDPDLLAKLDEWTSRQEFRMSRSAAIEVAIRRFLREADTSKGVQESAPARVPKRSVSKRYT